MGKNANYRIVKDVREELIIQDIGPWDVHKSVTNDVERVVKEIASKLRGRKLLVVDSEGNMDQIIVEDGEFAGFYYLKQRVE